MIKSCAILRHPIHFAQDVYHPCLEYPFCICFQPISCLLALSVIKSTVEVWSACVQVILTLLNNGPKAQKSSDAGSSGMSEAIKCMYE